MKNRICLLVYSFGLLILGLLLYLLLNQNVFVSKAVLSIFTIPTVSMPNSYPVNILRGYGADFLWSCAFTLVIQSIVYLHRKKIYMLLTCSLLGIIFEMMQFLGLVTGTSDIIDVLVYLLGTAFGILIIKGGKLYEKD